MTRVNLAAELAPGARRKRRIEKCKSRRLRYIELRLRYLYLFTTLLLVFSSATWSTAKEGSATKSELVLLFNGKNLVNGKNLDGWIQRGSKAQYKIEGDAIVGTSVADTPNSFLCTEREYGDFILEVEFKVANDLNFGIQIRSPVYEKPMAVAVKDSEGKTVTKKIAAGRVHGYPVEIDAGGQSWLGGIYDEARRG